MRNIKELLQLMLDNKALFERGLCFWTLNLYSKYIITEEEMGLLINYIHNNKPKFKWYNLYMLFTIRKGYYWTYDCIIPRIDWLKKHIKLNN